MSPVTLILLAVLYGAIGSPTGGASSLQPADPTSVVVSYFGNVNSADVDGNVALLAADAVHVTNRPGDGPATSTKGRDAILAAQRDSVAQGIQYTLSNVHASGEVVTFTKSWSYANGPNAGTQFTANAAALVVDGLIVSLTDNLTSGNGSSPPPASGIPAQAAGRG